MSSEDILVVAQTQGDTLADITLELLGAARLLAASTGGEVIGLILSENGARFADALSAADRILCLDDPLLANYAPQPYLDALEQVVRSETPRAVLIGSTSVGLDLASMLAARLDAPVVNGCQRVAVEGDGLTVTASFHAGKMLADVQVTGRPAILLILPGSYRETAETGRAHVLAMPSPEPLASGAVTFQQMILPAAGDVDITQEAILVGVGRGIQQEDDMEVAEELAEVLGGQLCASRPIVDLGWLPTTRQVGKSGMTVKPKCYFALGISGAPEHAEGLSGAELVIAVNTDPDAPIFEVADYGVVGDLMDVVPAVVETLRSRARA